MRVSQFKDRVDALLSQGLGELSMTLGVLARIDRNSYEIIAVQSNSGTYVRGEKYDLGESFSRDVCENRKVIATTSIDKASQPLLHPLYRSLPLESYIGAPIIVDGESWGCIDFSSMAQREAPFSESEQKMVDDLANKISQLLCSLDDDDTTVL